MKAVTFHGKRDVRVDTVPDPRIEHPTDAIVQITSTGICGSDLHLYEVMGAFMDEGDILGHEPMGIVQEVGADVVAHSSRATASSSRSTSRAATATCATSSSSPSARPPRCASRTRAPRCSATPSSTARCPAARPSTCASPRRTSARSRCPTGPPDERYVYLSDVLPTAWQAVQYAAIPEGGTVAVYGLGPIGQMSARIARHQGAGRVFGVDLVPERLEMAGRHGIEPIDAREGTSGRGPARSHRRTRPGLGHRRGRHGGARLAHGQARPPDRRDAA